MVTLAKSDKSNAKKSDMTATLRKLMSFFYELEAKVIETATEAEVTINAQDLNTRDLAIETDGEENYKETPSMFFEDMLLSLEVARKNSSKAPEIQHLTTKDAAVTASESIKILRGMQISPLMKLEEVEKALWERVRDLELEKNSSKGREPG